MAESINCDGCDKPIKQLNRSPYRGPVADGVSVKITPEIRVNVCSSPRYYTPHFRTLESELYPKLPCLRKAWEKAAVCPGCGEESNPFEGLCSDCRDVIARAKETLGDAPRIYSLDTDLVSSLYPDQEGREAAKELLDLICRIATTKGPRRRANGKFGPVLPRRDRGYREAHGGMPGVELDDDQLDAVEGLGAAIRKLVDAQYREGRKRGRDLLGGLAEGRLSIGEFEDKHVKWNQEESEENDG